MYLAFVEYFATVLSQETQKKYKKKEMLKKKEEEKTPISFGIDVNEKTDAVCISFFKFIKRRSHHILL